MDSLRGNKGYVHTADKGGPLCDSSDFLYDNVNNILIFLFSNLIPAIYMWL